MGVRIAYGADGVHDDRVQERSRRPRSWRRFERAWFGRSGGEGRRLGMAREERGVPRGRWPGSPDGPLAGEPGREPGRTAADQGVPDMVRELVGDVSDLVSRQVELARIEMREVAGQVQRNASQVGVAVCLLMAGALALTAFLVIGLGALLNGAYWASALIVGIVFACIGAIMLRRASHRLKPSELAPSHTIETLREDRDFAKREARDFRRDVQA